MKKDIIYDSYDFLGNLSDLPPIPSGDDDWEADWQRFWEDEMGEEKPVVKKCDCGAGHTEFKKYHYDWCSIKK